MKKRDISFARNLVKGKIAETVFAQMLRSTGVFTVLPFGYEKVNLELIGRGKGSKDDLMETLRTTPDFAVINNTTKEVHLIEVKYRATFVHKNVLDMAKRMSASWNPSYLFIASNEGFFFGEVKEIIAAKGKISALKHPQIPSETQIAFLKILNDFEDVVLSVD